MYYFNIFYFLVIMWATHSTDTQIVFNAQICQGSTLIYPMTCQCCPPAFMPNVEFNYISSFLMVSCHSSGIVFIVLYPQSWSSKNLRIQMTFQKYHNNRWCYNDPLCVWFGNVRQHFLTYFPLNISFAMDISCTCYSKKDTKPVYIHRDQACGKAPSCFSF